LISLDEYERGEQTRHTVVGDCWETRKSLSSLHGEVLTKKAPPQALDFQEAYLRLILGFVGLTEVSFIHSENQMKPDADASFAAATAQIGRILREQKQTIPVEAGQILKQTQRV
jgi:hypothetical protein